eukprot:gene8136-9006_t
MALIHLRKTFAALALFMFVARCRKISRTNESTVAAFYCIARDAILDEPAIFKNVTNGLVDCIDFCVEVAICKAINTHKRTDGKLDCHLLQEDHISKGTKVISKSGWKLYDTGSSATNKAIGPKCASKAVNPCAEHCSCVDTEDGHRCDCGEKETFPSCKAALQENHMAELHYWIKNAYMPKAVFAKCAKSQDGFYTSTFDHSPEQRTYVSGYEGPGSYKKSLSYSPNTIPDIMKFIDTVAAGCKQFTKVECTGILLLRNNHGYPISSKGLRIDKAKRFVFELNIKTKSCRFNFARQRDSDTDSCSSKAEFKMALIHLRKTFAALALFMFVARCRKISRTNESTVAAFYCIARDAILDEPAIFKNVTNGLVDCIDFCVEVAICKAVNTHKRTDGKLDCHLLQEDHISKGTKVISKSGWKLYDTGSSATNKAIGPKCASKAVNPCAEHCSCVDTADGHRCDCGEKENFPSCTTALHENHMAELHYWIKNADMAKAVFVKCTKSQDGLHISTFDHSQEQRTYVSGYEICASYKKPLGYAPNSMADIIKYIDTVAAGCKQFTKIEDCKRGSEGIPNKRLLITSMGSSPSKSKKSDVLLKINAMGAFKSASEIQGRREDDENQNKEVVDHKTGLITKQYSQNKTDDLPVQKTLIRTDSHQVSYEDTSVAWNKLRKTFQHQQRKTSRSSMKILQRALSLQEEISEHQPNFYDMNPHLNYNASRYVERQEECGICRTHDSRREPLHNCRICPRIYHHECLRSRGYLCDRLALAAIAESESSIGWSCSHCENLMNLLSDEEQAEVIESFEKMAGNDTSIDEFNYLAARKTSYVNLVGIQMSSLRERMERVFFAQMDRDNSGTIEWWEFVPTMCIRILNRRTTEELLEMATFPEIEKLESYFKNYDKNGDGVISLAAAKMAYGKWLLSLIKERPGEFIPDEWIGQLPEEWINGGDERQGLGHLLLKTQQEKQTLVTWEDFLSVNALHVLCARLNTVDTRPCLPSIDDALLSLNLGKNIVPGDDVEDGYIEDRDPIQMIKEKLNAF